MSTRKLDWAISDALALAFEKIDDLIRRGDFTADEAADALEHGWGDGVADGWREWCEEAGA